MLHTRYLEIGPLILEKMIFGRVFTIYGHVGPDPKPSLSYDTAQIKLYMSWNAKKYIDVAIIKNTFQTYHNDPSQSLR